MKFAEQFTALNRLLEETRQWWQFAAFHSRESRWTTYAPEFHVKMQSLRFGYADFNPVDQEELASDLQDLIPQLKSINRLTNFVRQDEIVEAPDTHWQYQIAGRKWSQISHFVPHVPSNEHLLEWCAGKGHLGRLAASKGAQSLTSLEWLAGLCDKNRALNERLQIDLICCPSSVHCCDVLSEKLGEHFQSHHFALALHACGDLHTRLLKQLVDVNGQGICLAPCCYNLIKDECYQSLSSQARASHLVLSKLDLSLPLRQLVTAGKREKREQQQERLWRIAFDCWQRQARGVDEYLPLPTIPKKILKGSFANFIRWAIERKSLDELPTGSLDFALEAAEIRLPAIAQMEWVQNHFQRALETWLLLDQVLFLETHGYQCELFEFCDVKDTPRNLMIRAVKKIRN